MSIPEGATAEADAIRIDKKEGDETLFSTTDVWNLQSFASRLGLTRERIDQLITNKNDPRSRDTLHQLLTQVHSWLPQDEEGTW